MDEAWDIARTGPELVRADTRQWVTPKDLTSEIVILVHGFTRNGRYMTNLATYFQGHGFVSLLFNYDSYLGIDVGAAALVTRLGAIQPHLGQRGYALVSHSMGGLVARHFAQSAPATLLTSLKGVALLGTPNQGTRVGLKWIQWMIDWAETLAGPNPFARSAACLAASQLTRSDPARLIEALNAHDAAHLPAMPIVSISGGQDYLEFGAARSFMTVGDAKNTALQKLLAYKPNDGLVIESSADITVVMGAGNARVRHRNDYPDYAGTNHTHLVRNQGIADILVKWLKQEVF